MTPGKPVLLPHFLDAELLGAVTPCRNTSQGQITLLQGGESDLKKDWIGAGDELKDYGATTCLSMIYVYVYIYIISIYNV